MATRPEEIEGSAARAADRGQPDGLSFFATPTPAEARYLGSPTDVAEIVREFGMAVHAIRSDAGHGRITGEEAMKRLDALCDRYAAIFYGRGGDGYRAMPFNSPEALGVFINGALGLDEHPGQAAKTLFMHTATRLLAAYEAFQKDETDEAGVQFQIEAANEDATTILMGLPFAPDED